MKKIEQIAPQLLKREIERTAPQIIKREVEHIAPKVIKTLTPWYIRWFYSIFGDGIRAMATSSIAPEATTASDSVLKSMDANRYATKKTIAQGMLDIALLTANASQLKYILQVGNRHEFYTLMLVLISLSIVMQVFSGVLNLSLSLMRDCRLHLIKFNNSANIINYLRSFLAFFIVFTNILVSAFDPTISPDPLLSNLDVIAACLSLVISTIDLSKSNKQRELANRLTHMSLGLVFISTFCNVIKMNFGLDPAA